MKAILLNIQKQFEKHLNDKEIPVKFQGEYTTF